MQCIPDSFASKTNVCEKIFFILNYCIEFSLFFSQGSQESLLAHGFVAGVVVVTTVLSLGTLALLLGVLRV